MEVENGNWIQAGDAADKVLARMTGECAATNARAHRRSARPRRASKRKTLAVLAFALLVAAPVAFAAERGEMLSGTATVVDGDTFDLVLADGTTHRIRLFGVDTPERFDKPFGPMATEFLREKIDGGTVTCLIVEPAAFSRLAGACRPSGKPREESFGAQLLRAGLARATPRFQREGITEAYAGLEAEARAAMRGMWAVVD